MRISTVASLLGHSFHLKFETFRTPNAGTRGVVARIPCTNEYMLFLDYDHISHPRLIDECTTLQDEFALGDFHIIETHPSSEHVICIDRLPAREEVEIMESSTCDPLYRHGLRLNKERSWVLRVAEKGNRPKPRYLYTLASEYNGMRLQAEGMGLFLRYYYKAEVRLSNPDGAYYIGIQDYMTASRIDVRKLPKIAEAVK